MATTTYVPIETYTLGSAASSVTFGSGGTIPQTYTDLVIVANTKNTANNGDEVGIRFNGDTGNTYSRTRLYGNGSSAAADRSTNTNKGALQINSTSDFTPLIAHIQNYSNETTYKTVISRGNSGSYVSAYVSLWRNTNKITSITLLPDSGTTFTSGSTFTLYGIANAAIMAKATGGIVTYDNTYFYHTFAASGTFTPSQSLTVDYLVVAGGGGGGRYKGGGGGAGGLRCTVDATGGGGSLESQLSLSSGTSYTVTIGAGGAKGIDGGGGSQDGSNGSNSVFSTITATGGGGGGGAYAGDSGAGKSGGSGGGGNADANTAGGARTVNQGFTGGNARVDAISNGGGGGGAGEAGNTDGGGEGGDGVATVINGTSTYYAGGGGAGSNVSAKSGGLGGGGTGGYTTLPTAGTANTGGGGGGGAGDSYGGSNQGANGGSGVVIIRYLKA